MVGSRVKTKLQDPDVKNHGEDEAKGKEPRWWSGTKAKNVEANAQTKVRDTEAGVTDHEDQEQAKSQKADMETSSIGTACKV